MIQNESDAQTAVWTHLRDLVHTDQGETIYNAARENICSQNSNKCLGSVNGATCPENSWDFTLHLFVDGGGYLVYPTIHQWVILTDVDTGRQVVWFGWIVESDGKVYPYNPNAEWLEKALQE